MAALSRRLSSIRPAMTRQRRVSMTNGEFVVPAVAYVIRNGRLDPEWAATRAQHAEHRRTRHQSP